MTVAAIYARKSTEQQVAAEAKSVTRQKEMAQAFAVSKGWAVDDRFVFEDDGISGAEFERRPGFMRLMGAALKPVPPFSILIVSEQKSLGREAFETNYTIKQLAEAGVEVFEYVHGQSLTPRNWLDKAMSAFRAAADEAHREQTRERVIEAHTRLAKAGRVTGGRIFGYRNVHKFSGEDLSGNPLRSHVDREVNPVEAAVVVRIFEMYDSGLGLKSIAKRLTLEGAPSPQPFQRKDRALSAVKGWCPSTVRAVLTRELYNGVLVWNKTRKKNDWGKKDVKDRPESEWVRTPAEHLRIVDPDLWTRVEARRREVEGRTVRFGSGRICGRPPKHAAVNLLAGLATCGVCGGGLVVEQSNNRKGRYAYYICHRRRHHASDCSNTLRVPVPLVNEEVLTAIEAHALTPEGVEQVLLSAERDDTQERKEALRRELKTIDTRLARLREAIEQGGELTVLVTGIRDLETRKRTIADELQSLQPIPRADAGVVEDRLTEWRRLLRQSVTQGRAVLQRILRGRITFTPRADGSGYDFEAQTRFDKLFSGIAVPVPDIWKGEEPVGAEGIRVEDTWDYDYGQLLERAYGKGLARPAGLEPATSWFVA